MTSTRLPGKMMIPIGEKPSLQVLIERLQRVPGLVDIVVATTMNSDDDPLNEVCDRMGVGCFRGSEEDVLGRVLGAARAFRGDVIVEITGDCTLIDPAIVQECIDAYKQSDADFVANCVQRPHYPPGMDARIFSSGLLAELDRITQSPDDREHVSLYFWEHPEQYKLHHVAPPPEFALPDLYIVLDEAADLEMLRCLHDALTPAKPDFGLSEILNFIREHPDVNAKSQLVSRRGAHGA